jgi:hypothetical protein
VGDIVSHPNGQRTSIIWTTSLEPLPPGTGTAGLSSIASCMRLSTRELVRHYDRLAASVPVSHTTTMTDHAQRHPEGISARKDVMPDQFAAIEARDVEGILAAYRPRAGSRRPRGRDC